MSNYSVTVYVNPTSLETFPGHAFIGLTNPAGETIYRGLYPNNRSILSFPSDSPPHEDFLVSGNNSVQGATGGAVIVDQLVFNNNELEYTYSITQDVTEAQGQAVMDAITRAENNPNDAYIIHGDGGDATQCTNLIRDILNAADVRMEGVNTASNSLIPDSLIDRMVDPDGSIEPNTTNSTVDVRLTPEEAGWTRRDEAPTDQQDGGGMNVSGVSNPEILDFDTWRSENRVQVASNDDDLTIEDVHAIQQSRYEAYLAENGIDPSGINGTTNGRGDGDWAASNDGAGTEQNNEIIPPTTPEDLLAGGSPDDAFANPAPPESSFIDAVGDTLENIGDALEEAWEDRGAQAVGAAASASFMTYANLNGWTEEDWLDESHEQSIASFVVNEVAQDIVTFDFSAGDYNLLEWNAVNADGQAVAGTGANMIASLAAGEIASELGLGGTDLASTVGTSMAVAGMQYTLSTVFTGGSLGWGAALTEGGSGFAGSFTNAGLGAVGSWAASQLLSSNTEAEMYGAAIGGALGTAFIPIPGVGAFVGSILGDSLGEAWNDISGEILDDGFQLEDTFAIAYELQEAAWDAVGAVFGMDEKPKPPVAEVTYSFNPETGVYEQSASHAHHGGKVSHVDGAAGQVADIAGSLLDRLTQGEAQLANRHEMPDIRIGYRGDHQYVMVDGEYIGSEINGENIQAAVGAILGDAVIEGGTALNNHLLYSDDLSDGERFAMMTDPVLTQVTQYHHNEAHQAQTDARLGVREEALDLMDQLDIDQAAFNTAAQNVQSLSAQLSQLSYPTARDDNPTQNQIKAYNAQKTSLEGRLDTAREVLSDAKQTLNATQSEAEPHFRAEHQSEFDQLQTQRSAVIGTDPFDALLARYDALQADQAALGDQRASVSSASLEASRLISAEQNSRDPSPSRIGQLQDRKAQYSSRLDDLSDQADVLTAEMDALFTDYLAALSAPLETELAELKASLAEHATLMTAQAEGTAEVATLENGASFSAEDIAAFNATKESLLNNQITALEQAA